MQHDNDSESMKRTQPFPFPRVCPPNAFPLPRTGGQAFPLPRLCLPKMLPIRQDQWVMERVKTDVAARTSTTRLGELGTSSTLDLEYDSRPVRK